MNVRVISVAVLLVVTSVAGASPAAAIVGGSTVSDPGPHVALLSVQSNSTAQVICSGTLVHERWVLTAAHCGADQPSDGGQVRVVVGVSNLFTVFSQDAVHDVAQVRNHPGWNPDHPAAAYDVALLELAEPTVVVPAMLPDTAVAVGSEVAAFGFGATSSALSGVGQLRTATRSVHELGADPGAPFITASADTQLCVGDSGGAVMQGDVVVGVHSFVVSTSGDACAAGSGSLAGHAPVFDVVDWIAATVGLADGGDDCGGLERAAQRVSGANGRAGELVDALHERCAAGSRGLVSSDS